MLGNLTGWHFLALLAIVLLVFGAAKLPALAKSMGQSARVFKGEMKAMKEDDATAAPKVESIAAPSPTVPTTVSTDAPVTRSGASDSQS
jgi:sec-independent protein translocase protein TatA